jgi:hypothetical protein
MTNITYGLMCLLVFMIVVHRMLKWLGLRHRGKQHLKRRHYEDHKWRSTSIKQSPRNEEKCCHWRTVRSRTPDCSVPHAGLSGVPGNSSPMASSWWHCGGGPRLSSATPDCLVQRLTAPTVDWQIQRLVAHWTGHWIVRCLPPDCPVCCRKLQLSSNGL